MKNGLEKIKLLVNILLTSSSVRQRIDDWLLYIRLRTNILLNLIVFDAYAI